MHILVLGAGVIGTTTAWYLRQAGHDVTVVDRQASAGLETSFANGGQISVCHAEPWANYRNLKKAIGWMSQPDAPLLFKPRLSPQLWQWLFGFLRQCPAPQVKNNITQLVQLGLSSRQALQQLRAQLNLQYDQATQGILHYYTCQQEFDAALAPTQLMNQLGCDRVAINTATVLDVEPALKHSTRPIVGGTYTPSDENGDAFKFTQQLAQHAQAAGVQFLYEHDILNITQQNNQITGVQVKQADGVQTTLTADAYVLCMGSYSPLLAKTLGLNLNIYPAKGYSLTAPITNNVLAPQVSLTDDEFKIVISRLGNRLRVAGTAEFTGYNLNLTPARCEALKRRIQTILPKAAYYDQAEYWTGLRPATPSNVPYIGQSAIKNLWLNTGHGTLGWTLACGSAKRLVNLMDSVA